MVSITMDYKGDLRCEAEHGPSGKKLVTDAPVDNQGRGETFSPTDLVATALITCMATIIGIRGRERNWPLSGLNLEVHKEMSTEGPRRIVRLPVQINFPSALPDDQRRIAEDAALNCPVFKSINPAIDVSVTFNWPKS